MVSMFNTITGNDAQQQKWAEKDVLSDDDDEDDALLSVGEQLVSEMKNLFNEIRRGDCVNTGVVNTLFNALSSKLF